MSALQSVIFYENNELKSKVDNIRQLNENTYTYKEEEMNVTWHFTKEAIVLERENDDYYLYLNFALDTAQLKIKREDIIFDIKIEQKEINKVHDGYEIYYQLESHDKICHIKLRKDD